MTNSGEGNDKRKGKSLNDMNDVVQMRTSEFDEATRFLDVKEKFLINEEDLNLNFSKATMLRVLKIIRDVKPNIIFTMNMHDYHNDHIETAKIAKEASFWAATGIRPELGKPHRTEIVLYGEGMLPIDPDVLVDISDYQEKKVELFKIYESQANSKALDFTISLMKVRGYHVRRNNVVEFAEAFNLNNKFPSLLFD